MSSADRQLPALSIVVPALNEEKSISELYFSIVQAMEGLDESAYEIIFIDDGSTDGTLGAMEKLAGDDDRLRIVSFRTNMGKAAG